MNKKLYITFFVLLNLIANIAVAGKGKKTNPWASAAKARSAERQRAKAKSITGAKHHQNEEKELKHFNQ
ncbi:hypothetical protein HN446_00305 [bacterium]|nr:hypothetical protein [bacterium]